MTCGNHCLLAWTFESVMRSVVCCLIIMTHVKQIHCVALIEVRRTITFLHHLKSITFVDGIFDWLVLLNAVYIFALLGCLCD